MKTKGDTNAIEVAHQKIAKKLTLTSCGDEAFAYLLSCVVAIVVDDATSGRSPSQKFLAAVTRLIKQGADGVATGWAAASVANRYQLSQWTRK